MEIQIALIGFGEAGATFARAAGWSARATAFDIDRSRSSAMRSSGVKAADNARAALLDADIVLSLVTADQALQSAQDYAGLCKPGALWCDMNSVAPATKCAAAVAIEAAGVRYVDAALLAPVNPAELVVPILLAGSASAQAEAALTAIGFRNVRCVGHEIGRASTIKMVRSVMVKGIEALTDEMMQGAEAAGVADEVLASLDQSETRKPWAERAAYNRERMATHGLRRAAEMEESAKTLSALGVEPAMTRGTIRRQRAAAEKSLREES